MSTLYIRNSDGDFVEIPSLKGDKGEDGIYFIPSIDADGNLVFEASEPDENGNIEVISMGGIKGKDGTSVTHEWVGTKLKVASASGVSEADLKGEPGKDAPQESILYTSQTLTKDQQEQARTNIDAASKDEVDRLNEEIVGQDVVRYGAAQALTEEQKAQARMNIGAAPLVVLTDEEMLMSEDGLTLTFENGGLYNKQWTASSTTIDSAVAGGDYRYCTRKIMTNKLPQYVDGGNTPWHYVLWKNGVNLGLSIMYVEAKANNFETDLDFDEVGVTWSYGYEFNPTYATFTTSSPSYQFNKVLVIGDSISADYYGNYTKWVTMLVEDGFFPSTNTTNDSIHATGFVAKYTADDPNADNDFLTRIEAVSNKETYDLVIIFGGINDFIHSVPMGGSDGETDTKTYFKPAVDYFFDYLVNNFTQARIVVLSPLRTYNPYPNQVSAKQEEYTAYIREVAKSYCLPILNLSEESGFMPFNDTFSNMWTYKGWTGGDGTTGDGVHPSEEYMRKFLAPMIKGFLMSIKPKSTI